VTHRRNADFLEIVRGQVTQYVSVDVILAECRLVLFETEVEEPIADIHRRVLRPGDVENGLSRG